MKDNSEEQHLSLALATIWGCSGLRKLRRTSRYAGARYHSRLERIVVSECSSEWTEKPTPEAITQAATRVRRSLYLAWGSVIGAIAVAIAAIALKPTALWFAVFFAPFVIGAWAAFVLVNTVRCPRCHHSYMRVVSRSDLPEPKACQHCKYRLFKDWDKVRRDTA